MTTFGAPYALSVAYLDEERGPAIEGTLGVYWWDGGTWVEVPSSLDEAANRLTASLDHMTPFAILGETHSVFLPVVLRDW